MKELNHIFVSEDMPAIEELRAALNKYVQQKDEKNLTFALFDIMCVLACACKKSDKNLAALLYALEAASREVESGHLANSLRDLREELYIVGDERGKKWGD